MDADEQIIRLDEKLKNLQQRLDSMEANCCSKATIQAQTTLVGKLDTLIESLSIFKGTVIKDISALEKRQLRHERIVYVVLGAAAALQFLGVGDIAKNILVGG